MIVVIVLQHSNRTFNGYTATHLQTFSLLCSCGHMNRFWPMRCKQSEMCLYGTGIYMGKYAFTFPSLASAGWYVDMMIEIGATMFFTRWKPHVEDGWSPTQKESGALNDLQRRTTRSVILFSSPHQEGRSTFLHSWLIYITLPCLLAGSITN